MLSDGLTPEIEFLPFGTKIEISMELADELDFYFNALGFKETWEKTISELNRKMKHDY